MNQYKEILRRAAEGGITLGVIFVCIFMLDSTANALLHFIALFLIIIYVPRFVYRKIRDSYFASYGSATLPTLWLEGILLFLHGGIILSLGIYIFLEWIAPDTLGIMITQFLANFKDYVQTYASDVDFDQIITEVRKIRPIDVALSMLWGVFLSGSIASLVMAAIAKSKPVPPPSIPNK